MILSNIKKKGYSVLAFSLNGEDDEEDLIFSDLKRIIKNNLKEIIDCSKECDIPEIISSDKEFLDVPGFYIIPSNDSYSVYNYLQNKWHKLNYDTLLRYNIRRI